MAKHIDVTHIDGLPFTSLSVDFMEECANCPVIDVKAEVSPGSLALTCYNAQACRAIREYRASLRFPVNLGDKLYFNDGSLGFVEEIRITTHGVLIFRCGKEIPPAKYYVDVEMGELGKTVFLNPHAAAKAMVAEAKDKEKRRDNETDDV